MCIVVMLVILLSSSYLALVQALRRDVLIFVIQLFQLRLSPEQSGKVEYKRERLLGIANKSNTSAKGCWESLINSLIY